jgi:hypothetical protein
VEIVGPNAADFEVVRQPEPTVVPPGGHVNFEVRFRPLSSGVRRATVRIVNTDFDEGNYEFVVQGESPSLLLGDVNADGSLDSTDIDVLYAAIRSRDPSTTYDLNADAMLNQSDIVELLRVLRTSYGDSNLDGIFDSSDLVLIFQAGQYEDNVLNNSLWSTGDWDGDLEFTTTDLVLAFQKGMYQA